MTSMARAAKQLSSLWLSTAVAIGVLTVAATAAEPADSKAAEPAPSWDGPLETRKKVDWPWETFDPRDSQASWDLAQALDMMNGTWKLRVRTNPAGQVMGLTAGGQWEGTTIIDLKPFYSRFGGNGAHGAHVPRGLGTIEVYETGVHEECCVLPQYVGQRGWEESNGTWTVDVLPPDHSIYQADDEYYYLAVTDTTRIVGDHTPLTNGWNHVITAYYRVARDGSSLLLLNQVGAEFFGKGAGPRDNNGIQLSDEMIDASDCSVAQFEVNGNVMKIGWTWGGHDEWVRVSR